MKFSRQTIEDIILIEPLVQGDDRGHFIETFRQDLLEKELGHSVNFVQDNESKSVKGVLRGLHFQIPPFAQSKLVRVLDGRVLDITVDIRRSSPSFGKHIAIELSSDNDKQLFVPRGFAHGFVVLSKTATFAYKVDNIYSPEYDRGLAFDDEQLAIDWLLPKEALLLSEKDNNQPVLTALEPSFSFGVNYYD